jgi:hypothetical protein
MSSAPPLRVGFDEIANMIRDLSIGVTPVSPKLRGALTAASMNVKSSFVVTTGKKKRTVDDAASANPTQSSTAPTNKRQRRAPATATLCSPSTTPATDAQSSATRHQSLAGFRVDPSHPPAVGLVYNWSDAMLFDRDIIRPHSTLRTSVIQPVYRRLLPSDIVRLMAGDEIIVVIPIHGDVPRRGNDADASRFHYRQLFYNVICRTFQGKDDSENNTESIIRERHTLLRGGKSYLEFPCRIKNYAERELFERSGVTLSAIKSSWAQGAGIGLAVCGYSP